MSPAQFLQHCGLPWQQPGLECTCSDVQRIILHKFHHIKVISKFVDPDYCHEHKIHRIRFNADGLARSHAEESLESPASGLEQKQSADCGHSLTVLLLQLHHALLGNRELLLR